MRQIFGFQHTIGHTKSPLDPKEQANFRYRLYARAIKINGVSQIKTLQPHLQARLERTLIEKINPQITTDGLIQYPRARYVLMVVSGWHAIRLAPIMRDFATGMLGIYIFGRKLCA